MTTGRCYRIGGSDTWVASVPFEDEKDVAENKRSPMAIHFVIDNSGSMGGATEQAKTVFSGLVDGAATAPCSLTLFENKATLQAEDITKTSQMLSLPRLPQGGTNIPAGVEKAMECILRRESKAERGEDHGSAEKTHHLLVLLTDGYHNSGSPPEVQFPKIGERYKKDIPDLQLSVVVVGITRNSSTSMGMLLKTSLETVPLGTDSVENIYFATHQNEMKDILGKLVAELEKVSTGKVRAISHPDRCLVSAFGSELSDTLTVRTIPRDTYTTILIRSKKTPDQILLDGERVELVCGVEEVDCDLIAEAIATHIDKIKIQRVASASPGTVRSAVDQLNELVDALENELSSNAVTKLALGKASGKDRLKQHRAMYRTTHMARELRNELADVVNFSASSSEEQAAFLNGRKSKFANKALRRAAARSGGDVVLDPAKELDKAYAELTSDNFVDDLATNLRADTMGHLATLSTAQIEQLSQHVLAASPSDADLLFEVIDSGVIDAFVEEARRKEKPTEKVHTSALCWIPPAGAGYEAIQKIRQTHDKQIARWPPHVNLLYPFEPSTQFEAAAGKLAEALRGCNPFDVTLRDIDHFVHGGKSCTAWLRPDETQAFTVLQAACQAALPDCDDLTSRGPFVPHLTVGQPKNKSAVEALAQNAAWQPTTFHCGEICMISRKGPNDPFEVHWRVQLGSGTSTPGPAAASCLMQGDKNMAKNESKDNLVSSASPQVQDFINSGTLAGYLNDVFFGGRQSYLSLSSPWEHASEWRDLRESNEKFRSQWEMLLYLGSVAYPISVERSPAAQMNPFQVTIRNINTTVVDSASLCCANQSEVDTYGPEGGEPLKDGLVLVDPSCPRASRKIASSSLLGETFTSVVISRDLHMYSGPSMKVALLANSLFSALQPELVGKSKADIVADIRREFQGKAYQCGSCGFGPVAHGGCANLATHHGEVDRVGVVASNACPSCGWFSKAIGEWQPWDGTVPNTLVEARSSKQTKSKDDDSDKPLQAKVDLVLRIAYSFRKQFLQRNNPVKEFYQDLAKKLAGWDTSISTRDGVDGVTQTLIALMACDDDVLLPGDDDDNSNKKCVQSAFAPPVILAIVNEACARRARKKFRMLSGGDEAKSRDLAVKHVTKLLGITEESAPTTTETLLEPEADRTVVEEGCSKDYCFDWDNEENADIAWARDIATRWCRAFAIVRAFRGYLVTRGGGWSKLERDMETSLDNYKDVVEHLQKQRLPSFTELCDIEPQAVKRTLLTMAIQAYLNNKGASRIELPDVRDGDTLSCAARDMRMKIYERRVGEKMAQWADEGQQLAFCQARACDIGQYESMIGGSRHVHGLSKEMFWGMWEAAIHDGHGGAKVEAFLDTANEGFCTAHAPSGGELIGKSRRKKKKK